MRLRPTIISSALVLAACGDIGSHLPAGVNPPDTGVTNPVGSPAPPVASISVAPDTGSFVVGDTVRLVVRPRDAHGVLLTGRAISYVSSDTTIATVSASALVRARVAGVVTITATSEQKHAAARFVVRAP